jgi:hypothetical protein
MTLPVGPRLDERRTPEFLGELRERGRAWIPAWDLAEGQRDFGLALLEIAARFSAEVAERFDRGAEKMQRGFFDWLAVRRKAAVPARMPVVFKLADTATEGVLAQRPVRLQADAAGNTVTFETETDVQVVPGRIDIVVAVDADKDALYLPWPGLVDLQPLEPVPTQWMPKSFAPAGAAIIQLDPELGLTLGTILEISGSQYRVEQAEKDLVTIEPPLEFDLTTSMAVSKVSAFAPFDEGARNWQAHALYLGDDELLNIEAEAAIEVIGSLRLRTGFTWQYWGKSEEDDIATWRPMPFDDSRQDAIVLKKPKGAMEQRNIGGKKGRWIRAYLKTVGPGEEPIRAEAFSVRINSSKCGPGLTKCPPDVVTPSPAAEAMANTTPLVLDNVFLPLGREPRQFDAFYLGSTEAFSKKGAQVRVCFELADPTFASLAVVRAGRWANSVVAGVGKDNALHVLQFVPATRAVSKFAGRDALRPPLPADAGAAPTQTSPVSLNPHCRPVISEIGNDFYIRVAGGRSIWTWHENDADSKLSGWREFSHLPDSAISERRIDDLLPVSQAGETVVLSNSELWVHDGAAWSKPRTKYSVPNPDVDVTLVALVPVLLNTSGVLAPSDRMVGVSIDKLLYSVAIGGECTPLPLDISAVVTELVDVDPREFASAKTGGVRPGAYSDGAGMLLVVTANDARDKLVAYLERPALNAVATRIDLPAGDKVIGATVDISIVNSAPQFSVLCTTAAGATYVASWQPFDLSNPLVSDTLLRSSISGDRLNGAPVTLTAHIVAPGAHGDLFVADFDHNQRRIGSVPTPLEDGVVLPQEPSAFLIDDQFSVFNRAGNDRLLQPVAAAGLSLPPDTEVLYPVAAPFGAVANDLELLAYRSSATQYTATIVDVDTITLDGGDAETAFGSVLLIDVGGAPDLYLVIDVTNYPDVDVFPDLPQAVGTPNYWTPQPRNGRVAPILRLDAITGNWDAARAGRARLYFPTATPDLQRSQVFEVAANQPRTLGLSAPWALPPAVGDPYIIDATLGEWQQVLADTSSNPELSWEYSNGTAWTSLRLEEEGTLHLKNTGAIRFRVPQDLAAVDWAGKTSHWIRARLIGGDYGKEKVTVTTTTVGNKSEQTVERSTEGIRPPSVVKLHISYGFCEGLQPTYLLTEDSGSTRDQSDANRSSGAIVEAFVPLDVLLGRLADAPRQGAGTETDDAADCGCEGSRAASSAITSPSASSSTSPSSPRLGGRAVFVGLTKPPSGEPVNTLFLVDLERDHSGQVPLDVRAHLRDHFVPVVADDATRGLGESGLIKLAFSETPTLRELFGRERAWLQLRPSPRGLSEWQPALRGAYLNGVWASATETLTRELLGSSDGAPKLTVKLARPPLLERTLELRVKEPLGEEERTQLRNEDPNLVLSDVDALPGDWVLWKQVTDPGDESPIARVYALDETNGEVRFGDGLHGAIPPIGVDSIVAFSYQRTEAGAPGATTVPGNLIGPRTALNLVTPVEGAESAIAADQSAGGAPPESPERVLRFGPTRLRHRDRAVSAQDIEDIALESSPDVAQARVFVRRDHLQLVVVMRGIKPVPNAAQIRELRRRLLTAAPVTLSAPGALTVSGPRIRRLRISLDLRVSSLDHAGAVTKDVRRQLAAFFDTAVGGTLEEGWPLGASPSEEDISYALIDVPLLQSVAAVTLNEIGRDGTEQPWPAALKPTELVVLAADPIRLHLLTTEEAA